MENELVFPEGLFDVLVVDPPWAYGSTSSAGKPGSAEGQYGTIGNEGKEVNRKTGAGVNSIANSVPIGQHASKDSALFLWVTNPKLPFGFQLLDAWGFTYKTTLTWVKTTKSDEVLRGGMGWFFRGATEHVLFATRGAFGIPASLREPNLIMARRGKHSEKPSAFYELVDRVIPEGRRIDVFARARRQGWETYGDDSSLTTAERP